MDRVRAGLTGLGLVFLVTVGASVLVAREPTATQPKEKSSEPLAQLGVAPGPDKEAARAAALAGQADAAGLPPEGGLAAPAAGEGAPAGPGGMGGMGGPSAQSAPDLPEAALAASERSGPAPAS